MGDWEYAGHDAERAPAAAPNDAPIVLRPARAPLHIQPEALAVGTAAQLVHAYDELEVQVNRAIPRRHLRAVAQHAVRAHADRCTTEDCLAARGWLHAVPVLRLVGEESA